MLAITTDLLAEGTHFLPGTDARRLGHKSLAVNLSDLAAMGADPRWFLLALALPEVDETWLAAFAGGMFATADAHRIELVGGDTTRGPRTIAITAIGTLPARPRAAGATPRPPAKTFGSPVRPATRRSAWRISRGESRWMPRPPRTASRGSKRRSRASRSG